MSTNKEGVKINAYISTLADLHALPSVRVSGFSTSRTLEQAPRRPEAYQHIIVMNLYGFFINRALCSGQPQLFKEGNLTRGMAAVN
jgi:hypothetical protein